MSATGAILSGSDTRTAVRAGLAMAQIGEFSFIIAGTGLASGATHEYLYSLAIAVAAITTFLTPFMIRASDTVGRFVEAHSPRPLILTQSLYAAWMERVRARPSRAKLAVGIAVIFGSSAMMVGIAAIYEIAWVRLDDVVAADIGIKRRPRSFSCAPPRLRWRFRRVSASGAARPAHRTHRHPGVQRQRPLAADRRDAIVLSQVLELAIIFATILLLLAAVAPFIQPGETLAMLLAAVAIIATMIWRGARAIQRHLEEVSRTLTAMRLPQCR